RYSSPLLGRKTPVVSLQRTTGPPAYSNAPMSGAEPRACPRISVPGACACRALSMAALPAGNCPYRLTRRTNSSRMEALPLRKVEPFQRGRTTLFWSIFKNGFATTRRASVDIGLPTSPDGIAAPPFQYRLLLSTKPVTLAPSPEEKSPIVPVGSDQILL